MDVVLYVENFVTVATAKEPNMTISAKIIADSISPAGIRLTTLQLRYPKFIHSEFLTHRVLSRNASSSRAIPVERLIKDVIDDPVFPSFWGKNQPGMSADEECNAPVVHEEFGYDWSNKEAWSRARDSAIQYANAYNKAGYHKQIVNRLLEPFCHINVVVTATEWSNFFALRCHPAAQPEMRILAEAIRVAMGKGAPQPLQLGEWHTPYVNYMRDDMGTDNDWAIKLSVARCARVSYLTQDGRLPNAEEDLKLYDRLVGSMPLHASPCEHQATPDEQPPAHLEQDGYEWKRSDLHGNLKGWIQYRKTLPNECVSSKSERAK